MATDKNAGVVTRFAPSPTGPFQVGGVRTALFNYLFARQQGGKYILRCEDTDPARSKKEYEEYFLAVFKWLGLSHDEYYRQSERTDIYQRYLEKLIAEGKAFISKEQPKEEGGRTEVIRFKNPGKVVVFEDKVLGEISVDTTDLGDFVIARDLRSPLYHFTVVVDDHEMGVTHVIRGQDHVANTPRQILIQEAIGAKRPIYAHLPLILSKDRKKLSKRDPNVTPTLTYRDEGYLPEALVNFMALIGWNPGGEKELFTLDELITTFSLDRIQKAGGIFNPEKLEWLNREHVKQLLPDEQFTWIERFLPKTITGNSGYSANKLRRVVPIMIERISHFGEVFEMAEAGDLLYYFEQPTYPKEKLFWKDERDITKLAQRLLHVRGLLTLIDEKDFAPEKIKGALWNYAEEEGRGQVLWPLRYALSGRDKSPDPFTLASIMGKEEVLRRINYAHSLLESQ